MATEVDRHRVAAHTAQGLHASAYFPSATSRTNNSNGTMNMTMHKNPLKAAVEIVEDRLYYISLKTKPLSQEGGVYKRDATTAQKRPVYYFSIDNELVYWNFFLDFGPLNLGQLYRFCTKLNSLLEQRPNHIICFYSSHAPAKRANAVCLIGCWQILYLNRSPEEALNGFRLALAATNVTFPTVTTAAAAATSSPSSSPPASPTCNTNTTAANSNNASLPPLSRRANPTIAPLPFFHDASPCACTYELSVLDCLRGLAKARLYGFFDFATFDVNEYEHFEQVENGDLNWIIYGKILAFAGPSYERRVSPEGYCTLSPADYIPYFKEKKVALVVRLNRKAYNEDDFKKAGIDHLEQFYVDGSCPPIKILDRVIEGFESVPKDKAFAVHCKAGLGRTGTCIGAYIMKHYRFTASEVIAWMRICRPGCVIGPQQQFLKEIEQRMWQLGALEGSIKASKKICANLTFNCLSAANVAGAAAACQSGITKDADDDNDNPLLLSGNTCATDEAVVGRAGQAEGLLGARTRNRPGGIMSFVGGASGVVVGSNNSKSNNNNNNNRTSRKHGVPPNPEMTPKSSKSTGSGKVVTPDPPGKSKCDGGHWYT